MKLKQKQRLAALCSAALLLGNLCTAAAYAAEETDLSKEPQKITLNEVAHSIFYAPQYAAVELGYFEEEGILLDLVTGFGADKVMTAVLTGEAQIGFMGSEASIYTYTQGASDYPVNFAQLTQRAGNFLIAREPMEEFTWEDIKGKYVLGGRKGGMPEMVFEYILRQNGIDPASDLKINQSIDFGSTAAAFTSGQGDFTVEFTIILHPQYHVDCGIQRQRRLPLFSFAAISHSAAAPRSSPPPCRN